MRLILGLASLAGSMHLVRLAMDDLKGGMLIAAIPAMVITYLLLRKAIFSPFELYGVNVFSSGTKLSKFDRRFKEFDELRSKGKLKSALEHIDAILKKHPKFKQAQIRKIQLLANDFYEVTKAYEYSKEILQNGRFNRNKMHILILITAMLRKQGFGAEAARLAEEYRQKTKGHYRRLIEKMEETRRYAGGPV